MKSLFDSLGRRKTWQQTPKDRGITICGECNQEFKIRRQSGKSQFCSQVCAAKNVGRRTLKLNRREQTPSPIHKCLNCGIEFRASPSTNRRFCSQRCSSVHPPTSQQRLLAWHSKPKPRLYSRTPKQWLDFNGKRIFCRSKWEANYARYLEWQKAAKLILDWQHEPHTFWFKNIKRGVRSYLPDFKVTLLNGSHEWHEVKGWMDARSKTKIKRMAKYHPTERLIVIGSDWFKNANRTVKFLVPNWQ